MRTDYTKKVGNWEDFQLHSRGVEHKVLFERSVILFVFSLSSLTFLLGEIMARIVTCIGTSLVCPQWKSLH